LFSVMLAEDVERFVRYYEGDLGRRVLEAEAGLVNMYIDEGDLVLDLGCGIGVFEWKVKGRVVGLDLSKHALGKAAEKNRVEEGKRDFVLADGEAMCFRSGVFDAVFSVTAVEFVDEPFRAIREAARISKSNGKIIVLALNPDSEYFKSKVARGKTYFERMKHKPGEIREILARFYDILEEKLVLEVRSGSVSAEGSRQHSTIHLIYGVKKERGTMSTRHSWGCEEGF